MKKIALIYISTGTGGCSEVVRQIAYKLSLQQDVTVIANNELRNYFYSTKFSFSGVHSSLINKSYFLRFLRFIIRRWLDKDYFLKQKLKVIFNKNQFDIIHLHSPFALSIFELKWKKESKLVYTDHDAIYNIKIKHHFNIDLNYSSFLHNLKNLDGITSPSERSLKRLIKLTSPSKQLKYEVIRNGLNTPNKIPNRDLSSIRAIFPGGSNSIKGLNKFIYLLESTSIELLQEIGFRLYILGECEQFTKTYVNESWLNPYIIFTGHLSSIDYNKILKKSNVYINFSESEILPLALLESLSHNIIPFVKDVGAITEILSKDENCIIVNEDSFIEDFKNLKNIDFLNNIYENNKLISSGFHWDKISNQYSNFYSLLK